MKICDRCGAQLEDNAKFCSECGAKQEPKKCSCPNCGTELNPNAKFCSECGTPAVSAQADRSEDKKQESTAGLSGIAKEIQEQGGIIVYNDKDEAEVEAAKKLLVDLDPDMGYYLSEDFDLHKLIDKFTKSFNLKFKKFGEPGRDILEYGYPDDDYRGKIEYAILDDEKLILRGEGSTFRVLSDKAQKESEENFWVLNTAIRKLKDRIDTILVEGDTTSLRARLFKDFSRLDTVILGEGVHGIRVETFAGCPIKNIVLPSTIWHLVESAFIGAKFKSFFIPPLPKQDFFNQFQSDSFVDCKNLKYVFLPQRLFKACRVSNFFKGCDSLDADNVWEVKDLMFENNNLLTNKKETLMEEKKKDPILGTKEFDAEGRPVVSLTFKMYYLNGDEDSADAFMESKSEGLGIFVAVGSDEPSSAPFKNYRFMAPVDAFYEGYYAYKDKDPDGAADLLNRGLVMYAYTEELFVSGNEYQGNESCEAALELIFGEDNPKNYNGPEAIFKIKVVDGDANDEDMKDYCIRVYQNEEGKWTSEELEN